MTIGHFENVMIVHFIHLRWEPSARLVLFYIKTGIVYEAYMMPEKCNQNNFEKITDVPSSNTTYIDSVCSARREVGGGHP